MTPDHGSKRVNDGDFKKGVPVDVEEDIETQNLIKIENLTNNMRIVIDLANILYQDLDRNGNLKVSNIIRLGSKLLLENYSPIIIADA